MYRSLYEIAIKDNSDMVCSGYILEGNYISEEYDSIPEGCYRDDKKKSLLDKVIFNLPEHELGLRGSLCCKIFKRDELINAQNLIPDEISYSEDKLCVLTLALNCNCISVIRNAWYHYILNNSSMTHNPDTHYLNKINSVYRYLISLYNHPDFNDNMRRQSELYVTQLLIKGINTRMGFSIPNLMWIDRNWMYEVPEESRILLYGSGTLCDTYARQIINSGRLELIGCINKADEAVKYEYDYIVITYKYFPKSQEIRDELINIGVDNESILWFEQDEVFWDYAEDAGICRV